MGTRVTALTIGGFDPTGTVGIGVDLRTFAAGGVHGLGVITVVTAQDTVSFGSVMALSDHTVGEQLDVLLDDIVPEAMKTGMLWNSSVASTVAHAIADSALERVVVDPVLVDGAGQRIIGEDVDAVYRDHLFPNATVITPNRSEAGLLLQRDVVTTNDASSAAIDLLDFGANVVVVTGGVAEDAADVIATGGRTCVVHHHRYGSQPIRGSGDTLSAAVAACLATGAAVDDAIARAMAFTALAIIRGLNLSVGKGRPSAAQSFTDWTAVDEVNASESVELAELFRD
jgi:hydroxymethylpyrimidine kinase/phosphomethylpyrimidine kinase